jgi:heterodisulfide reductase subunit A-like polyferredoxin
MTAKIIKLIDGDICIECKKCGSQTWYAIIDPDNNQDLIRLECGNPDCDAIIPFDLEDEIELILDD